MGGGGGEVTQSNMPWGPQGEQLEHLFSLAREQYGETPRYYPFNTVAGQSGASGQAQQSAYERLIGGSPDLDSASAYNQDVLSGQYMSPDSNPWLRQMGDMGASDITRHYQTAVSPNLSMAGSGQAGSAREVNAHSGARQDLGKSLSGYYADLYGSAYDRERGRMGQAAGVATDLAGARRADIGTAAGVGQIGDAYAQRGYDADVNRYDYGRDIRGRQLEEFRRMVTPQWQVGESTSTQPGQSSAAPIAGMAMSMISSMLMATSSRSYKDHVGEVYPVALSHVMGRVPVSRWSYKPEAPVIGAHDDSVHIGPMAEDWHEAFGTGDGKSIPYVDYLGTLMAALQGALIRVGHLEKTISALAKASGSESVEFEPMPEGV